MSKTTRPKPPRCPACGDTEPIELPPRRTGYRTWTRQWHCLECGNDFDGETFSKDSAE